MGCPWNTSDGIGKIQTCTETRIICQQKYFRLRRITVKQNADFTITANTMKGDQDLEDRWGDNIVGLQTENEILVMDYLRNEFYKMMYKGL